MILVFHDLKRNFRFAIAAQGNALQTVLALEVAHQLVAGPVGQAEVADDQIARLACGIAAV